MYTSIISYSSIKSEEEGSWDYEGGARAAHQSPPFVQLTAHNPSVVFTMCLGHHDINYVISSEIYKPLLESR